MPDDMNNEDITPLELAARIAAGDTPVILDVREPWEFDLAHITDSILVPLSTLAVASGQLDRAAEYVMVCHHGMRSAMGTDTLRAHGFMRVLNLVGGIDAWSTDVDAAVARY